MLWPPPGALLAFAPTARDCGLGGSANLGRRWLLKSLSDDMISGEDGVGEMLLPEGACWGEVWTSNPLCGGPSPWSASSPPLACLSIMTHVVSHKRATPDENTITIFDVVR